MPRKTKEQSEILEKEQTKKATNKKTTTTKNATKSTTTKKAGTAKKSTTKASTTKKTTAKTSSTKKSETAKKALTKSKKVTAKKTTSATTKKATTKKVTLKSTRKKAIPIVEYYDLPYRYNQTIVKLLAQTPKNLFVYWDISDEDREKYKKTYGENFFEETKPILIIHNKTLNYSFEVEINDFANSWYIHVNDSKCDYSIELGRRPIPSVSHIPTEYIHVSSSNEIESPNDKILFNIAENKVYFRNVKTNVTSTRSISFIKSMGKIYNIYDFYGSIYNEEILEEIFEEIEDVPSSTFK